MSKSATTYPRTAALEQVVERPQVEPHQDKEEVDDEGMSTQLGWPPRGERPWANMNNTTGYTWK